MHLWFFFHLAIFQQKNLKLPHFLSPLRTLCFPWHGPHVPTPAPVLATATAPQSKESKDGRKQRKTHEARGWDDLNSNSPPADCPTKLPFWAQVPGNETAWWNYVHMTSKDCNKTAGGFFFTPQLRRQSSNSIQLPTHVLHEQLVFASLVSSWPKKMPLNLKKNNKSCLSSPSTGRMFPQESASTRIKVLGNL